MGLMRAFVDHVRSRGLIAPGADVLVACSGGADSTALALLVRLCGKELGVRRTALAHLDHALRPGSVDDARFVQSLAGRLELRCVAERRPITADAGESPEAAARRGRYAFLAETARREASSVVLTAHQLDDQAETVLLRILRGTGVEGLAAMAARRPLDERRAPGVELVRPLLRHRRAELEAFLRERGVPWREDPTNLGGNVRGRLRWEALPILRNCVGRDPIPLLARMADNAADVVSDSRLAREAGLAFLEREGDGIRVLSEFARLPAAAQTTAAADALRRVRGEALPPSRAEANRLLELLTGSRAGPVRGVRVVAGARGRVIVPAADPARAAPDTAGAELSAPGQVALPWCGLTVRARVCAATNEPFLERLRRSDGSLELLDAAALQLPLRVRARRPGDRFEALGVPVPSRLGHYLQRRGVPATERDHVPLVEDRRGIVWVVGHGIAHRVRVMPTTRRILLLDSAAARP